MSCTPTPTLRRMRIRARRSSSAATASTSTTTTARNTSRAWPASGTPRWGSRRSASSRRRRPSWGNCPSITRSPTARRAPSSISPSGSSGTPRRPCRRYSSPARGRRRWIPRSRFVWYYHNAIGKPEKKKIISRRGGYHGVTVASSSLTGLGAVQKGFDVPIPNLIQTDCPHYYRHGEEGGIGGGVRHAHGGQPGETDSGGRAGDRGGVHRRTRDGCRRRHPAARDLLRQGATDPEQIRRPLHRRRGDLRVRAHRQHVGVADLRPRSRHGDHGQGDLGGIPAHRRDDVQREDLSGPAPGEFGDRAVRTRLHLYGASRLRGRRPGDAEDLRGAGAPSPTRRPSRPVSSKG